MSLPVTNGQASAPTQPASAPLGAIMMMTGKVKEYAGNTFKRAKAWSEVLDRNALSKPSNMSEAAIRLRKNFTYFKVNYLIVMIACISVGFILHPSSLFVLAVLMAAWIYLFVIRQAPLTINGRTISDREKLIGMGVISFITVFYFSSVSSVVFTWFLLGTAIVALHGATRVPDDLFIDDVESSNTGIMGMFVAPTAALASATAV